MRPRFVPWQLDELPHPIDTKAMFLRSLSVMACLSALVVAQRGEQPGEVGVEEQVRMKRQALAEEGSDAKSSGEKGDPDNAFDKMTPEQRLNHNIRHGASAYCGFVASVKPARLMPGQTGTLIVTAILRGQAVLPAPAPLEVTSAAQQGWLTFGAMNFRPAGPGKLASGYLGKPVYDNFAIFEVPVTMGTEAVMGRKIPISLDLKFDLYDGVSTQAVGRFTDRASTEVEVGRSADPSVIAGVHSDGSNAAAAHAAEGSSDAAKGSAAVNPPGKTIDGASIAAPVEATPVPLPPQPAVNESAPLSEDDSLPLPPLLLIGGGVVLLLVLVLLFAKRR